MQQRAFTLVELLTVVSMIGIGGGLAAFAMSEQIMDARAKSEANTVLQDLRAEHRAAREQMFGLKITTTTTGVKFQNTRGEDCTDPVGPPRGQAYKAARLSIVSPSTGACFNARGEPDPPGGPNSGPTGVIVGGPQLNTSTLTTAPTSPSALTAPTDIVLAVEAKLSNPALQYFMPLRVDRAGIADIGGKTMSVAEATTTKTDLLTDPDEALNNLDKDLGEVVVDATPLVPSPIIAGVDANGNAIAPECPLDGDGLPTTCTLGGAIN